MSYAVQTLIRSVAFTSIAMLAGLAKADTTINLSTGLDASNTLLTAGGSTDAHWTVDAPAGGTESAQVVARGNADFWGGWQDNGPSSDWIARNAFTSNNGPAPYAFYRTFDLTGFDLSTVTVSGAWEIDDEGTLSLNGRQIGPYHVHDEWNQGLESFSVGASYLLPGLNTLTINMAADDQLCEGIRFDGTVVGQVPEPSSACVLSLGGALGLIRRRPAR